MSKTYVYKGARKVESREHATHHRYDGHKMAAQVNHTNFERYAHTPTIERRGTRGK